MYFVGAARQSGVGAFQARDAERGIPEDDPLFFLDDLGSDVDAECPQRSQLLFGDAAHSRAYMELGREIGGQLRPSASRGPDSHFGDDRVSVVDAQPETEVGSAFASPGELQGRGFELGGESIGGFVLAQVTGQIRRGGGRKSQGGHNSSDNGSEDVHAANEGQFR